MSRQEFANQHRREYVEFCTTIVNEYNSKHIDCMILSDVLDKNYTYDFFYVTFLVLSAKAHHV